MSRRTQPVTLRAMWRGDDPQPGQYLQARQGRLAYIIVTVARIPGVPALGTHRLRLKCWRMARSEVPDGAVVYEWKWDARRVRPARRHAYVEGK